VKRTIILILAIILLAVLTMACDNWDGMDRSDWGWNGENGASTEPVDDLDGTRETEPQRVASFVWGG